MLLLVVPFVVDGRALAEDVRTLDNGVTLILHPIPSLPWCHRELCAARWISQEESKGPIGS